MNYRNPELQDRLAAEYVLGTLHGRARARFERLLRKETSLQETVHSWEVRLNPLAGQLPQEQPPRRVWRAIERRIRPMPHSRFWQSLALWRGLALAGSLAALAFGLYVALQPPRIAEPSAIAVFNRTDGQPMWVVAALPAKNQLEVHSVNPPTVQPNQDLELWLIPPGGKPQSLGLLPREGSRRLPLPNLSGGTLAVSLEPAGGSPTGQPTGPVLYQTPVVRL
jgi:anti-sigma-K factor RskA